MIYLFYSDISVASENYDFIDFCSERKSYLCSITDNLRFKQSFYVWKLLLRAFDFLGEKTEVFTENNGKWRLLGSKFNFSLSHSKNIVCVSISKKLNGVDVEMISNKILNVKKKLNVNTDDVNELTKMWTERECSIKEKRCKSYKHFLVADALNNNYDVCVGFQNENENIILRKIDNL